MVTHVLDRFAAALPCLGMAVIFSALGALPLQAEENRPATAVSNSSAAKQSDSVKRLIADLSANDYRTREDATRQLATAGPEAVGQLAEAAAGEDLEVAFRAIRILQAMVISQRPGVESQALAALEQLAAHEASSTADLANDALEFYRVARQERAIEELRRLGAEVNIYGTELPGSVNETLSITIGAAKWRGRTADLALLQFVPNLMELNFYGLKLDDEAIKPLSKLQKPGKINFFGTGISEAACAKIAEKLPPSETKIERRGGAKLGVRGNSLVNGCIIDSVQQGSAAHQAGLQTGDEIVLFEGKPVINFKDLTDLIAEKNPSESITLQIRRGDDVIDKKVPLGHWD
jgi:hypothetical protein